MSSADQDKSFKKAIGDELPNSMLGTAIDWIRDNMNPDEVFNMARIKSFVGNTCLPDDVFSDEELKKWSESKGYTRPARINYTELG